MPVVFGAKAVDKLKAREACLGTARHPQTGKVIDSLVGDGSIVAGQVEHSVLFRGVHVAHGASVHDSILLQDVDVGAGAQLACVILDKDVRVRPGARLVGTPAHPVIVKRGEVV